MRLNLFVAVDAVLRVRYPQHFGLEYGSAKMLLDPDLFSSADPDLHPNLMHPNHCVVRSLKMTIDEEEIWQP